MNLQTMLREIEEAGGEINVLECHYAPFDREAVRLGLLIVKDINSGWGFTETLSLTARGRQWVGLQHRTQPARTVGLRQITALLGKFSPRSESLSLRLTEE